MEELLRYVSPVNDATLRFTGEPVELGGVPIGPGEVVLVALSGANRDASRYADPERLDVGRDAGGHLAFGHGIHYCLGAPLARLEAEIAFGGLLERYGEMTLAVPPDDAALAAQLAHPWPGIPARAAGPVAAPAAAAPAWAGARTTARSVRKAGQSRLAGSSSASSSAPESASPGSSEGTPVTW